MPEVHCMGYQLQYSKPPQTLVAQNNRNALFFTMLKVEWMAPLFHVVLARITHANAFI